MSYYIGMNTYHQTSSSSTASSFNVRDRQHHTTSMQAFILVAFLVTAAFQYSTDSQKFQRFQHGFRELIGIRLAGEVQSVDLPVVPPLMECWRGLVISKVLGDHAVDCYLQHYYHYYISNHEYWILLLHRHLRHC